jgi:hypothetical protein
MGGGAGLAPALVELCAKGEGRNDEDVTGVGTIYAVDGTGDTSRDIGDLTKSCVRTSSIGLAPACGSKPLPRVRIDGVVPGKGEAPLLDIGEPPPKVRDIGSEIFGFAFAFSLLPPNLNRPTLLGLRCDDVEVEVGREVGVDISLEWDEVVKLCASSASSAAVLESRVGNTGLGVEVRIAADVAGANGFGLELGLGLVRGVDCEVSAFGEENDAVGLRVDAETGGVALVVANLAAIGGKGTIDAEAGPDAESGAELEVEAEAESIGADVEADPDTEKGVVGIGGTTGVGFDFRLKNDGDFLGLPESEE